MKDSAHRAVAVVGVSAIMPGAADAKTFWKNLKSGIYSITDVDPERWNPDFYYDPDPETPDATYSKIGGWVRDWEWAPFDWKLPIPPKVGNAMDEAQRWGIACTRALLQDYGYPERPLDKDRTAVILGNAMAGEKHYLTALRVSFPEFARELEEAESFRELPEELRKKIVAEARAGLRERIPDITEDSMPGELANVMAGRIANLFDLHGPNYVVDAACASAMAAISAAIEGLEEHDYDAVITGGIDRNMGASTFVKFCKIGALSATGTRPYADGADGFVMGEGAALFLLKRLEDAERDGDHIYAVLRGMGGSSDGKGKGITAPNPVGQKFAVQRAWENAGLSPSTATYVEGHGTSTRVGDVVEVQSLTDVFSSAGAEPSSIALGSVKSNIGHLKGAAGAAGILKTVMALDEKILPPSLNCGSKNPNIDFEHSPFYVNGDLKDWEKPECGVRRAGVSAFGFGGTNFHAVFEEYQPGRLTTDRKVKTTTSDTSSAPVTGLAAAAKAPPGGAIVLGADTAAELGARLKALKIDAEANKTLGGEPPLARDLNAPERIAIDFKNPKDLSRKIDLAQKALERDEPSLWSALTSQGVFRGSGDKQKVAFLYPGQGSQYVNMLAELRNREPGVRAVFEQADRVMAPLLDGKGLSDYIFVDDGDEAAVGAANGALRQTEITQPAVLAVDCALTELLDEYGVRPDMVMGHSLGEYAALVRAGVLTLPEALEAVSARGREMTKVAVEDNGKMAAVFAPLEDIQRIIASIDGYIVIANINSLEQAVIGGESAAIDLAIERFSAEGVQIVPLPVSHAFHTKIVAPASEPLKEVLARMRIQEPALPVISNVTGGFYATGEGAAANVIDALGKQIASPVQFIKGLESLYDAGIRVFVEVGPKKALKGFVDSVLGDRGDVVSLFANHPKIGDVTSFNQVLCGLYAAGHGNGRAEAQAAAVAKPEAVTAPAVTPPPAPSQDRTLEAKAELTALFDDFIRRGQQILSGTTQTDTGRIVISGAALGLPGAHKLFDDENVGRILHGEQFIDVIPMRFRQAMTEKHITRLVKPEKGDPTFVSIDDTKDVIKLSGRSGEFDIAAEYDIKPERAQAFDSTTAMAVAVGLDALRDAGIPLVLSYKTTTTGGKLPERWRLPDALRDETGVIFASAFPGMDAFSEQLDDYYTERGHREQLEGLESLREWFAHQGNGSGAGVDEIDRRISELKSLVGKTEFKFDRRFLFRVLSMGHSQFAEEIGARGPNTQVNGACASTTQAVALAEDWIRGGRCKRVIIVSADNVTSDHLIEWIGSGFLATGAAATDENPEDAATPFDRRRHGMIPGMGAAAIVVEAEDLTRARGLQPIAEVLGSVTANSAFHGTRLDINHISAVMEELVAKAERNHGISRTQIAPQTMFMSHETYTPARGGSASAEIHALRSVFGDKADDIVISNTKGFTGHAMGAGIEDVVAIKALETGIVPPVPNFKEVDPELGELNLSTGGSYPVQYALRLGAGFGSQLAMSLTRWIPSPDGHRRNPDQLGFEYRIADRDRWNAWLSSLSGYEHAELEVDSHRLRVKDQGPPANQPVGAVVRPRSEPAPAPAAEADVGAVVRPRSEPESGDDVEAQVIRIVAEKTDYPPDMLDLELDLEADLGVDTVKQAEVFAEIRGHYGIERDENLKLSEFPTLAHVVGFVRDRRPDVVGAVVRPRSDSEPAPAPEPTAAPVDDVEQQVIRIVAEKTDYPPDMLDLDLDLEADLGVDTVKQAEVFAEIRGHYDIPRDENLQLSEFPTLRHVVGFVNDRRPDQPAAAAEPVTEPVGAVVRPRSEAEPADDVEQQVIRIVAEKTDYPPDMLELDLDLEADLGVDTVKQAEVFAEIRGHYGIPRDENLQLSEFPTLRHVVGFVNDRRPDQPVGAVVRPRAEPEPAPAAETAVATDPDADIRQRVLEIVAEMTGYPEDMLDMELDLEADLGVDTVKQAEIFAAMRESYGIPRDPDLQLADFPTLNHAVQFVKDRMPASDEPSVGAVVRPRSESDTEAALQGDMDAANALPRRVPTAVHRPSLDLCRATGVELVEGKRVIVMPDNGGVGKALIERLEKRGVETLVLEPSDGSQACGEVVRAWAEKGPIDGVYWLPALDAHDGIETMDEATWQQAVDGRIKSLYEAVRPIYETLDTSAHFLVAATRLGGRHGYDADGAINPLGGAVSGFIKAIKREKNDVLCKVVDFAPSRKTAALADRLIDETLSDPGIVEVGYADDARWTIGLRDIRCDGSDTGLELGKDTVFVVTGAAGSIVSAIVGDLATASGGTFHLLDLAPEPDPSDPDIAKFASDRDGLKRDIFERLKAGGERATPAMVEKELARLERAEAALSAIEAIERSGGKAHYHSVDLTDSDALASVMAEVYETSGKVDVLVHAAGVEISHFLSDKPRDEFDLVFDVKSNAWHSLMRAIGDKPLAAAVVFSSVAGRFGNGGQTDYSAANDFLTKSVMSFANSRPETRGIAIDWTAWGGIGMATRGSIPTMMAAAGIDMLPPEAGIPVVRRELTQGPAAREIVVGDRLGILMSEWDDAGGADLDALSDVGSRGPMLGRVTGYGLYKGLTVETELDPGDQAFLYDHKIDGTPVLPGVMGLEAFAELSTLLLPEYRVASIDDVQFMAPFKFYRDEPRSVRISAQFAEDRGQPVAYCTLEGEREIKTQDEPVVTKHFTATVRLTKSAPEELRIETPALSAENAIGSDAVYQVYFHGPAYQVLDSAWEGDTDTAVGRLASDLPANHSPEDQETLIAPRLIELCFQTAGMYELGVDGRFGLPAKIGRVERLKDPSIVKAQFFTVVRHGNGGRGFDAEVVDENGEVYLRMQDYHTAELPGAAEAAAIDPIKAVFQPQ
ncbi:MAG: SDR family NAD(P)-dependent oxidoreductase [Woeseiaceae bacterium]|nr:SDR family NAD(P)-dependent oxidoreductase [Woeseiaceae bacterium]